MAHAHVHTYTQQLKVTVESGEEIYIACGPFSVRMNFEEAASLAVDLLIAAKTAPTAERGA